MFLFQYFYGDEDGGVNDDLEIATISECTAILNALRIPLDPLHILKKDLRKNQASKADRRFTKDSLTNTSRIPKIKPAKITLLVLIGHLVIIKRNCETPDRGLIMLSVWSFETILFFDDDISSAPDDNVLW